jgi:hypothetical protein
MTVSRRLSARYQTPPCCSIPLLYCVVELREALTLRGFSLYFLYFSREAITIYTESGTVTWDEERSSEAAMVGGAQKRPFLRVNQSKRLVRAAY